MSEPTYYKKCSVCKKTLADHRFYHDSRNISGLSSRCKTCSRAISAAWRQNNPDRYKKYHREYKQERRDQEIASALQRILDSQVENPILPMDNTPTLPTKICSSCKKEKSIARFPKRVTAPDGHHAMCKLCLKETKEQS